MKKKLLFTFFAVVAFSILLFTNAMAARQSECPVTMVSKGSYSSTNTSTTTVNHFDIWYAENRPGEYKNRLYYTFEYSDYMDLNLICYDAQGMPLETLEFNPYRDYIDVPDITATVELLPENPADTTDTFFYCKYMNVYAADGRVMAIYDLQSPIYQMVGWHLPVTVYAEDGRSMEISPFQVDAYAQVGWYTERHLLFRRVQALYNQYKSAGDYASILDLVEDNLAYFEGSKYLDSMYAIRTDAMDCWRKAINSPLAIRDYEISENSIGVPEASIWFSNVSYKTIVAFKIKFTCYNIFGQIENTYYDSYYVDDAYMEPSGQDYFVWTLYGADSVNRLTNMRITEVVFSDGTKWYR